MRSFKNSRFAAGAALVASASTALAHEESGWASIHWHTGDFLGLATVGVLAVAALWLARRQTRAAKQ